METTLTREGGFKYYLEPTLIHLSIIEASQHRHKNPRTTNNLQENNSITTSWESQLWHEYLSLGNKTDDLKYSLYHFCFIMQYLLSCKIRVKYII
jgi:hypothetical protein